MKCNSPRGFLHCVCFFMNYPVHVLFALRWGLEMSGAYHLTEKSGWGVESIMVSDLPVYRRNATSVTV